MYRILTPRNLLYSEPSEVENPACVCTDCANMHRWSQGGLVSTAVEAGVGYITPTTLLTTPKRLVYIKRQLFARTQVNHPRCCNQHLERDCLGCDARYLFLLLTFCTMHASCGSGVAVVGLAVFA